MSLLLLSLSLCARLSSPVSLSLFEAAAASESSSSLERNGGRKADDDGDRRPRTEDEGDTLWTPQPRERLCSRSTQLLVCVLPKRGASSKRFISEMCCKILEICVHDYAKIWKLSIIRLSLFIYHMNTLHVYEYVHAYLPFHSCRIRRQRCYKLCIL